MKNLLPLFLLAASVVGCRQSLVRDEYCVQPATENSRWAAGSKTVWNDKDQVVGFVEIQDGALKGQNYEDEEYLKPVGVEVHRAWFVKDRNYNLIGYITERGNTYKFKRDSVDTVHVGNYTIDDGIRTLLGITTRFDLRPTKVED
ncbi:MAG: hypothetical protein AAB074_17600 [Planctomycetota bacterium]